MKIVDDAKKTWGNMGTTTKILVGGVAMLFGVGIVKGLLARKSAAPVDPITADGQKLLDDVKATMGNGPDGLGDDRELAEHMSGLAGGWGGSGYRDLGNLG